MSMYVKPVRNEKDYTAAQKRMLELLRSEPTPEIADELDIILVLLDAYDRENHPIPLPDPIRAIKFHMDRLDLNLSDLLPVFNSLDTARAVLEKRRAMNLREIRQLHELLDLDIETLAQDYEIVHRSCAASTYETSVQGFSITRPLDRDQMYSEEESRAEFFGCLDTDKENYVKQETQEANRSADLFFGVKSQLGSMDPGDYSSTDPSIRFVVAA